MTLPINASCCRRCAQPLTEPGVCGQCRRHPPPFTSSVAPWLYQPPLDALVLQLKTSAAMAPARTLGRLLALEIAATREAGLPDLLLPVPLHRDRLRERGFNRAALIARQL